MTQSASSRAKGVLSCRIPNVPNCWLLSVTWTRWLSFRRLMFAALFVSFARKFTPKAPTTLPQLCPSEMRCWHTVAEWRLSEIPRAILLLTSSNPRGGYEDVASRFVLYPNVGKDCRDIKRSARGRVPGCCGLAGCCTIGDHCALVGSGHHLWSGTGAGKCRQHVLHAPGNCSGGKRC